MLKAMYITCAVFTYAPFLLFHALVSIMVWDSTAWDKACLMLYDLVNEITDPKD